MRRSTGYGMLVLPAVIAGSFVSVLQPARSQAPAQSSPQTATIAKPQLPDGPLLQSAPEFSHWVEDFSYAEDRNKNATAGSTSPALTTRPRRRTITKTKNIICEETIDLAGKPTIRWHSGQTQYTKTTGQAIWSQSDVPSSGSISDRNYSPLPGNGYRELDFAKPENYAGVVQYAGLNCLVVLPGGSSKVNLSDSKQIASLEGQHTVAYIDAKTRLPVALKLGGELRKFTFTAPPAAMQTLPADLLAEIKQGEEGRAKLYQPAPRPY